MCKFRVLAIRLFFLFLFALALNVALAQDPVKVAPETYKVTVDNADVRVLDVHIKPGGKSPMHSHPGYVAVAFNTCKIRFTSADGKTQEVEFKPGDSVWRDAETHSAENIGTTECHALNVELKNATKKK